MKNNKLNYLIALVVLVFSVWNSNAQGCSDAGFCSVGNGFKVTDVYLKNNFEVGAVYGIAEEDITVFSQYLSYTRNFSKSFGVNLKVTSSIANGDLGTNTNIGDAFVTGNYNFKSKSKSKWSILMGVKIPFTSANDKIDGVSLPMAYQSSLGTFDFISGIGLSYKKWEFNIAYQLPLTKYNENTYFDVLLEADEFNSTNLFGRKSDGLFRAAYIIKTPNEKFTFKPNMLLIYHFGEDSFENSLGIRENIDNSEGTTLNANLIATYKINATSYLETSIASPLVIRSERPDGLSRLVTLGLAYKIIF